MEAQVGPGGILAPFILQISYLFLFAYILLKQEELMASESWEGLPALLLDDGVGGRTRTQGLCPRPCLSLPAPPGPLPPGRVLPRSAPPEVTHCDSLGGSHAASPRAASRGQHPPRKRLPPRGGNLRRLSSNRRQFCFCCCVTVLARRLFASFLFLTLTGLFRPARRLPLDQADSRLVVSSDISP